ncbi:UNVERIFIED_CONTAM: hypothetical protein Slati_4026500 [Sesamum latifolium]|uniref:TTI1 N-terminal TPR domain-containing protein n=1 Tax=Sesamum latifolium TaxID=2727402 RepID=A0AAW2TU47_9LAMI
MKFDSKNNPLEPNTLATAYKVSDSVAEGVVLCLEEVLKKCRIGSVDQAADIEATRGHRGSSRLRVEALMTLRVLIAKVLTDVLSYGPPDRCCKSDWEGVHASKTMISGAAGSSEALDQALRGLTEYLIIVLEDGATTSILGAPTDEVSGLHPRKEKPLASFLEELRHLPLKNPLPDDRTADWLANTTAHVNKLMSATFPHLCVHPSRKVRLGLLASVEALLCKCSYALRESRLMLLECLCILVCDDSEDVSSYAQTFFRLLVSSRRKHQVEHDIAEVFSRLVEKLPQVILGNEESLALSHARKLLAVTYFGGRRLIADYLLQSPVAAARFLDVFALCLSQNSVFAGSLTKLAAKRPSASGFMHSISEMKAITSAENEILSY